VQDEAQADLVKVEALESRDKGNERPMDAAARA
jgi:hypothetical protein